MSNSFKILKVVFKTVDPDQLASDGMILSTKDSSQPLY